MSALGLLGVALVLLKVLGYIHLGWGWVLLPFYGGLAVWAFFLIVWTILIAISGGVAETHRPYRHRSRF